MKPIRTRDDLLALVAQHAPSKACARAVSEGRATVLGGFKSPKCLPCWIVHVQSQHKRVWVIKISCDEATQKFPVEFLEYCEIQWEHWIGDSCGKRPLIDGDDPINFSLMRVGALWSKRNGPITA